MQEYKKKLDTFPLTCSHLYCPEVTGEQQDDGHHVGDEAFIDELTEQVGEDGTDSEEEVEESSHWMPIGSHFNILAQHQQVNCKRKSSNSSSKRIRLSLSRQESMSAFWSHNIHLLTYLIFAFDLFPASSSASNRATSSSLVS